MPFALGRSIPCHLGGRFGRCPCLMSAATLGERDLGQFVKLNPANRESAHEPTKWRLAGYRAPGAEMCCWGACVRYGRRLATGWNGSIFPMQSIGKMPEHEKSSEALRNPWSPRDGKPQECCWKTGPKTTPWRGRPLPIRRARSGQAAARQSQRSHRVLTAERQEA
jgi:hypothetical protein